MRIKHLKINAKEIQKYVDGERYRCPLCNAKDLSIKDTPNEIDKTIYRANECLACGFKFDDVFELSRIIPIEIPKDQCIDKLIDHEEVPL